MRLQITEIGGGYKLFARTYVEELGISISATEFVSYLEIEHMKLV